MAPGPALLWLWHRPAPTALIQTLPWELPYAMGAGPKKKKKKKKNQGRGVPLKKGQS